jgi:hypothetical protein
MRRQVFDPTLVVRTRRIVTLPVSDILVADGSAWVAVLPTDAVWQLDERRGVLLRTIPVHDLPVSLALADGALWVVCDPDEGAGTVRRVDPSSGDVVQVIEVGHSPRGAAAANGLLFVAVR